MTWTALPQCPSIFLSLQMWEVASVSPLLSRPCRRGRNTVCFPTTCWASLTLVSEEMDRPSAGQIWTRRIWPHPILHLLTCHRGTTCMHCLTNSVGTERAPQPTSHSGPVSEVGSRGTCLVGRESRRVKARQLLLKDTRYLGMVTHTFSLST